MKNTELLQLESGIIAPNTSIMKATKRLSRPFKIKSILLSSGGPHTYTLQVRIFIGSPDTTDPINDPSCREITSKLGTSEGIATYSAHPIVWPELNIKIDQQDKAILVRWYSNNSDAVWAVINFHLQMM